MAFQKILSKSNYLNGIQSTKLLWISVNDKKRIPEVTEVEQKKFDDGTSIGELATGLFPKGISLAEESFRDNLDKTLEVLKKKVPIFEAGFKIDRIYSRADILRPVGNKWDIIEVKSATSVKEINLHDVAFQKYVYEKAGLKINKCYLMHINNEYVKRGKINPKELFIQEDITEQIKPYELDVEVNIDKFLKIIDGKEPDFEVEDLLTIEYDNICLDEFMNSLPDESIFEFYRMFTKKKVELFKKGFVRMIDLPEDFKLNEKQEIQRKLALDRGVHINKKGIKSFIDSLEKPIYYLDFETINPILPKFNGMKPYQRIPFQFSLHIEDSDLKHISFLAEGVNDPRPLFLESLKKNLGEKGTILVYNESFEKGVLRECVQAFPEYQSWYEDNIFPRVKDLLDVFKDFHYYDSRQKGSASIKAVLPVMSNLSHKNLELIQKGDEASYEWERVTFGKVSKKEREEVRKALEEYCKLDTLAEVEILNKLREIVD